MEAVVKEKLQLKRLVVEMLEEDFLEVKMLSIVQGVTLKRLVINALAEYVARNEKLK